MTCFRTSLLRSLRSFGGPSVALREGGACDVPLAVKPTYAIAL